MKAFMAFILSLIYHCIFNVYLRSQKGTSGSYGEEDRSPRDPGCSAGCSAWIALWVILLGWLCVVPLLELALMSSEEPATGTGQPVTGDTRNWLGCHERSVKPRSQLPSERQWLLCLAGKLRKKEF